MPRTSERKTTLSECAMKALLYDRIRQERQIARPFDGAGQHAVMFGAVAGGTGRDHLSALRHKIAQDRRVLVIDVHHAVHAEPADLAPRRPPPAGTAAFFAASGSSGSFAALRSGG